MTNEILTRKEIVKLTPPQKITYTALQERRKREARLEKAERAERLIRGIAAAERAPKIATSWIWFFVVVAIVLFVISPAALGFLKILAEIPEWLFYAMIGMFVLIFLLRRRRR